jgi:PAS domain S-box-containing protein
MGSQEHQARLHPDDRERVVRVLEGLQQPGQVARCEYRTRHRDGHYVDFEATMRCVEMPDRNGVGLIMVSRDISERRRAEQALRDSESRFRLLIENLQVGVLLQGPSAEMLLYNRQALELLGLTESQLLGRTSFDENWKVIHEDGSPFPGPAHPVPQAIATRQPVRNVVMGVYRPTTESIVWLLVNAEPELDSEGHVKQVVCSFIDITERRAAEAQRHELETKRRTLGNLRRFLNDVTHDLRTPLSVINTSLYLLQRHMSQEHRHLRYMQSIDEQVAHLIRIVEDMSDMSQLDYEEANIRLAPSNINALVAMAVSAFEESIASKDIRLTLERDELLPPLMADEALLARALRYILNNAVIYTPPGGTIAVSTFRQENQLLIEVCDSGIGIDDTDLPHIFEPFYRGDKSRTISEAGTGLGLTMALEIVEAHGGSIGVQTTPGKGSTFSVRLELK